MMQVGHFVQVEIIRYDLGFPLLRQFNQLQVDLANAGKIIRHNLHLNAAIRLHALQHVKSPAPALALRSIGGIGDHLQLAQHELRDDHQSLDESGFSDIRDAAVDDHAGVEKLCTAL